MASLRKRFSWALGDQKRSRSAKGHHSLDVNRGSLDSGYQDVSQSSNLSPYAYQGSPKSSPRKLHKALSTTFDYLANTVRQGATYIYQGVIENDDDLSGGSDSANSTPKATPKRHSRRPSLFSSVRSRKGLFSPKARNGEVEWTGSLGSSPKRTRVPGESSEFAPTLVGIGKSLESVSTLVRVGSEKSGLSPTTTRIVDDMAPTLDVHIPNSSLDNKDSRQGPTSQPVELMGGAGSESQVPPMEDPFTSRDDLSSHVRIFITSAMASPPGPASKAPFVEDNGYIAECESGAEQSGNEELSPACLKFTAPTSPEAETSMACDHPHPVPVVRSHASPAAARPYLSTIQSQIHKNMGGLPSDVYEADLEVSESSTNAAPSMGPRAVFEQGLADRNRRYLAAIWGAARSEENISTDLQLSSSPRMVSSPSQGNTDGKRCTPEAAGQLHSSMPSMHLNRDFTENSPLKHASFLGREDAYEAALRAAGLSTPTRSRQPSSSRTIRQESECSTSGAKPHVVTPENHLRTASNLSDVTNDSCAVTTSSPSCNAPPPFPVLHIRSEPAFRSVSGIRALEADKGQIPIAGPANLGLHPVSPVNSGETAIAGSDNIGSHPSSPVISGAEDLVTAKTEDTIPQKVFNAARHPNFELPSKKIASPNGSGSLLPVGTSPKSKRSLRKKKKASQRKCTKAVPSLKDATHTSSNLQPHFRLKHFAPADQATSPYTGHELEAIVNPVQKERVSSPMVDEKKGVTFAEEEEIIGHSVFVRRLSPASSRRSKALPEQARAGDKENEE